MEHSSLGQSLLNYAKAPSDAGTARSNSGLESALDALTNGKNSSANTNHGTSTQQNGLQNHEGRNSPDPRRSETPNRLSQRQSLAAAARIPLAANTRMDNGYPPASTPRRNRVESPRSVRSVDHHPAGIWSPSVLSESDFNPPSTVDTNRYHHQHIGFKLKHDARDTKRETGKDMGREDVFVGVGMDNSRRWGRRDSRPPAFSISDGKVSVTGIQAPVRTTADYRGSPERAPSQSAARDADSKPRPAYPNNLFGSDSDDDHDEDENAGGEPENFRKNAIQHPVAPRPMQPHRQTALDLANDDLDSLLDEDEMEDDDVFGSKSEASDQLTPKATRKTAVKMASKSHLPQQQAQGAVHPAPLTSRPPLSSILSKMARATSESNFQKRRRPSYDYDDSVLQKMDYSELKSQPFDYDPAVAPALQTTVGHGETLPAQLLHYKTRTDADQRDFFSRMTVTDWERSGDWFLDQFGDLVQQVIQARKDRRAIVGQFESEVASREEQVRTKHDSIERKMNKMKHNGLKVVGDEL
ncbi:hypothetical protein HOO65_010957 [Ceratocystis lukuohia]|uniref:Extracellular mutant protein 11 C-terminal domain-containing protein n=1 Tax=Ceratocystis lukuohia TaxID=2019550 RepID=A0ABR4MTJ0_9PEZI